MLGIEKGRAGRPPDTIIVTGASTGLGLETALRLAGEGFTVFAGVRDLGKRPDVLQAAAERGVQVAVLKLDLDDRESIDQAVGTVVAATGGVFALVNNGGIGLRGCLEDCAEEEIRRVFETNVLGTIALTKAVVPHMRAAGCGRVVTVSSVGGRVCGFGVSVYCASKFAQEGLGEALALELAPFGVQSVIIEPGIINTSRWWSHRGTAKAANDPESPYHGLFWASEAEADRIVERSPTRPRDVAEAIHTAVTAEQPRMRYVVGRGAAMVIALRRYMPQPLFERLYFGGQIRRLESTVKASRPSPPTVRAVP
jgi:NAD(P)-dependent dehydrogenase (short-subunit alcohol dehydrogenase family)